MLISFKRTYIVQAPYRPVQGHHIYKEDPLLHVGGEVHQLTQS